MMTSAVPEGWPELRVVRSWAETGPVYTIKDVADACELPQPAIAQVVPRTWTDGGWMYTGAQIRLAIDIAHDIRQAASTPDSSTFRPHCQMSDGWTTRRAELGEAVEQ